MSAALAQNPDAVLVNGRIVTADERGTVHEALAIHEERILALGTSAEIKRRARRSTRAIDLAGRTMIPDLTDSHMHAFRAA